MKLAHLLCLLFVFGCSNGDKSHSQNDIGSNRDTISAVKTGIEDSDSKPLHTEELTIRKDSRIFYGNRELKDSSSVYNLIKEFADKNYTVGIIADSTAKVGALYKVLNACTTFKVRLYVRTKIG